MALLVDFGSETTIGIDICIVSDCTTKLLWVIDAIGASIFQVLSAGVDFSAVS